jgi:hypothetical protein
MKKISQAVGVSSGLAVAFIIVARLGMQLRSANRREKQSANEN